MITVQVCRECLTTFHGTRADARRFGWEPYSRRTQADLERGPMICDRCVGRFLDDVLAALRAYPKSTDSWSRSDLSSGHE